MFGITLEQLKKYKPSKNKFTPRFKEGTVIKPIKILGGEHQKQWGKVDANTPKMVDVLQVEGGQTYPMPLIMGMIIQTGDEVLNPDDDKMKCFDPNATTLLEYFEKLKPNEEFQFPKEITIGRVMPKGADKGFFENADKKEMYVKQFEAENWDELVKDFKFIPSMYKTKSGTLFPNNGTSIVPPEI